MRDADREELKVRSDRSPVVEVLRMPSTVESRSDLGRVESDEPPDLQVGHPSFGDEPADVADAHPQPLGELVNGEKLWQGVGIGHWSP